MAAQRRAPPTPGSSARVPDESVVAVGSQPRPSRLSAEVVPYPGVSHRVRGRTLALAVLLGLGLAHLAVKNWPPRAIIVPVSLDAQVIVT